MKNPFYPGVNITYRMLFTHRSSIRDFPAGDINRLYGPSGADLNYGDRAKGNPTCSIKKLGAFITEVFKGPPNLSGVGETNWFYAHKQKAPFLNYRPGAKDTYSNLAATLGGFLVQRISGMDFAQFCETKIFKPLGMTSTGWFRENLPNNGNDAAKMFYKNEYSGKLVETLYCFVDYPDGQLWTTPADIVKFGVAMLQFGKGLYKKEETAKKAFSCQDYIFPQSRCDWGLGWVLDDASYYRPVIRGPKTPGFCYLVKGKKQCKLPMHDGAETGVSTLFLLVCI